MILRLAAVLLLGCVSTASATITLNSYFGTIQTSTAGTPAPLGSIGILVADIDNALASMPTASDLLGLTLTEGTVFGSGGYKIIDLFQVTDIDPFTGGTQYGFNNSQGGISLTGGLSTGNQLGLYWFPTVSTIGTTLSGGESYGFFRTATATDGSIGFTVPTDGANSTLAHVTTSANGSRSNSDFVATNVVAVPEPSRFCLLGLALMGLIMRRRR